mmetsp:Transcript_29739/g.70894  ORF Transcript_29739/g.70894 Transcript_29739/m.70894 type:complete len:380 (+) Transcript_29739:200-1339(+)
MIKFGCVAKLTSVSPKDRVVAGHLSLGDSRSLALSACAVFDGHNGSSTALFCRQNFFSELMRWFPERPLPPENDVLSFQAHLFDIRKALTRTFYELDQRSLKAGYTSGCTASAIVVTGWLVTVANVGDSDVLIQTPREHRVVTQNHRLGADAKELQRLETEGAQVARLSSLLRGPAALGDTGVGSVRIWPGGLALSRAIGDAALKQHVVAAPHITQLRIPFAGARFIAATNGVWDNIQLKKVSSILCSHPLKRSALEVVRNAIPSHGNLDDASAVLIDVLPRDVEDFSEVAPKGLKRLSLLSSCCLTSKQKVEDGDSRAEMQVLWQGDMIEVLPKIAEESAVSQQRELDRGQHELRRQACKGQCLPPTPEILEITSSRA